MESFSKEKGFSGISQRLHGYGVATVLFGLVDAIIIITCSSACKGADFNFI
jgi:hypothetical protein